MSQPTQTQTPKAGFFSQPLFATAKADLASGVVVFLVALPLCLGIALASGAPSMAGIVSGAIAGLLLAWMSGSQLSISGPAAGLTVIVASGITKLGGFPAFLCAVIVGGVLQIALGALRAGFLAGIFPTSVIEGMLAAIGAIIILKQIPHALGRDAEFEGSEAFWQHLDHENTFTEILRAIYSFSSGAVAITLVSLAAFFLWERLRPRFGVSMRFLPGALLAVVSGTLLNEAFQALAPTWAVSAQAGQLVQLPAATGLGDFFSHLTRPDFSAFLRLETYKLGLTLAIVASVGTVLSIEAVDKIDPMKRVSNTNRELLGQGVSNVLAGFLGGLPMNSVIVRSSVNVYAGAQSRLSCFFHGALLLLSVLLLPSLLNRIPLATLAAVLFTVGYKLARFGLFKKMYRLGAAQFIPFVVTFVAVIATDLLTGVFIGLLVGLAVVIKASFYTSVTYVKEGNDHLIRFAKDTSFINKLRLKELLSAIPDGANLIIDGTQAMFIDHDIYEVVDDFRESATRRRIQTEMRNMDGKRYSFFLAR